ncbi:MAG: aromatic amino acid ammonia-lyase, partial [Prevotellaceae bacterium]|nr:aromatic amino acid ammonia-lyase [Prevotellaceae bacterium]
MKITTNDLSISQLKAIVFDNECIELDKEVLQNIQSCFDFLQIFSSDKIIYGINTGFGPMAQYRVDDDFLTQLQYNIIRSHSTGAGNPLPDLYVRAAMVARLGTFLQARSGVHLELVQLLVEFINRGIYPFIPEHGSVGASGDLVQLAHIALTLIGEGKVHYKGEWREAADVLKETGLQPFEIHIREGLSVTNGTSVMSGIGLINVLYSKRLLDLAILASVWINELTQAYDDGFSVELNQTKKHVGQAEVAARMREISKDSKLLQ